MYKEPDVLRVFEGDQSAALFFCLHNQLTNVVLFGIN